MNKIPTIFERDWDGDRSRVLDKPVAECAWVFAGEGRATRKYDGTCCLVVNGRLWKRHEVRAGKAEPEEFELADYDAETGKTIGWVPVGGGPEDRWHREAFDSQAPEGTYELVGPKIQGNPERAESHVLIPHASAEEFGGVMRTFDGLQEFLSTHDIEGVVFHHPNGRMAKIKGRDFGVKRAALPTLP